MIRLRVVSALVLLASTLAFAQDPFISTKLWVAMREEASGAVPYENLRFLTRLHRVPATPPFDEAAAFIAQRAGEYGLSKVQSEQFPIDGATSYGLMRSYLAWKVEQGQLWEVGPQHLLIGDWATNPIRLADYSRTADVQTALVDVGNGAHDSDYSGKDVQGKIVLADGVLARVQALAIGKYGAVGIVSDMPNQSTAWSGLDKTLIRWGHLDARQAAGFAFMVSRETADAFRARLRAGETILLSAKVQATVGPGHWTVVNATIPGTDSKAGEVVYSCHLDHERPGANDNGSGCVTILESARLLARLIETGAIPRPRRTMRFVWGPEVEGTMAFLARHPEIRSKLVADIHMDMVGGDFFKNKSVFHLTATPWSLPSFVTDVGANLLETIRAGAANYAESGSDPAAAVVETRLGDLGTRNQFIANVTPYAAGSDHDDYDSSTIAVPSLYLRDWPDLYIHTDHDTLEQIDATKLRRVALLGAASGYVYANLDAAQLPQLLPYIAAQSKIRLSQRFNQAQDWMDLPGDPVHSWYEARNLMTQVLKREIGVLHSLVATAGGTSDADSEAVKQVTQLTSDYYSALTVEARAKGIRAVAPTAPWAGDASANKVPERVGEFGPLTYQNDDVLRARLGAERVSKIKLLNSEATPMLNVEDQSELYAYEIVNFVDGKRTVGEIRDAVSAEYGPLPIALVADYLQACAEAKVVKWK